MEKQDFNATYERIKTIIEAVGSTENVEESNKLIEELETLLPFQTAIEHEMWLDLTTYFKFWENWEDTTMEIAERLLN